MDKVNDAMKYLKNINFKFIFVCAALVMSIITVIFCVIVYETEEITKNQSIGLFTSSILSIAMIVILIDVYSKKTGAKITK